MARLGIDYLKGNGVKFLKISDHRAPSPDYA